MNNSHQNALSQQAKLLSRACFAFLIVVGMSSSCFGQLYVNTNPQVNQIDGQNINGSPPQTHTFIACESDGLITVECWGAGGGGGLAQTNGRATAGGGGGAYARSIITVTPGRSYTVHVGGGGEGWQQIGNGTQDALQRPGGPSYFQDNVTGDILVLAAGGNSCRTNMETAPGLGGAAADCIGTVTFSGGNGAGSTFTGTGGGKTYFISGAGGGGAGSGGAGGNAVAGTTGSGGLGAADLGGNGANGLTTAGNQGNTGNTFGGGGSGGWKGGGGTPNMYGGFGAHGAVRITGSAESGGCPLPVELISFSLQCENEAVDLKWSTASELNSSHYSLQNSRDGINWVEVTEIQAAGTSNHTINYSYRDNTVSSLSYYRLMQVDFDGAMQIYGPISAQCESNNSSIKVYPNPSNGHFTMDISSDVQEENAQVMIYNTNGQSVYQQTVNLSKGTNSLFFEKSALKTGIYFIRIDAKNIKLLPQKLIIY